MDFGVYPVQTLTAVPRIIKHRNGINKNVCDICLCMPWLGLTRATLACFVYFDHYLLHTAPQPSIYLLLFMCFMCVRGGERLLCASLLAFYYCWLFYFRFSPAIAVVVFNR